MRTADKWQDYRIIDTSDGMKLESWGGRILSRPDPQVIWKTEKRSPLWDNAHARYIRSDKGGGS